MKIEKTNFGSILSLYVYKFILFIEFILIQLKEEKKRTKTSNI